MSDALLPPVYPEPATPPASNARRFAYAKQFLPQVSPTARPTATASPNFTSSPFSGGLSEGAKAGIGVGASFGFLALLAIGALVWRRRRRNRERKETAPFTDKAELSGEGKTIAELPDSNMSVPELGTERGIHEMDGMSRPAELQGD